MAGAAAKGWLATAEHDHVVEVARNLFRCPTAAVTLTEAGDDCPFNREVALYGRPLVVEDALVDARFRDSVLVRAYPNVRFYLGTAVRVCGLVPIGTLAVMDYTKRARPTASELAALVALAALAGSEIEKALLQQAGPAQRAQFDFLVERARTGVLTVGLDGRIAAGNMAAQRLLRLPPDRLVGSQADDHVIGWRILVDDFRLGGSGGPKEPGASGAGPQRALRTVLVELVTGELGIVPALASLSLWIVEGVPAFRLIIDEVP